MFQQSGDILVPSVAIYLLAISTIEQKCTHISINNKTKSIMQTFLSVKFVAGSDLDSISYIWKYFCCQANFCFIILISEGSFFPPPVPELPFLEVGKWLFPTDIGKI